MSAVTDDVLAELKQNLERKRAELINKSKLARNEIRDNPMQGVGDSLDESTEEQGRSTMLRLADRDKHLLAKINAAIKRMDTEEFGYCLKCEEPINEQRLRARPMTTMCIECKEDQERRDSHRKIRPGLLDD